MCHHERAEYVHDDDYDDAAPHGRRRTGSYALKFSRTGSASGLPIHGGRFFIATTRGV
jgi:hypothetical protein